jgi:hypothetical protein
MTWAARIGAPCGDPDTGWARGGRATLRQDYWESCEGRTYIYCGPSCFEEEGRPPSITFIDPEGRRLTRPLGGCDETRP